LAFVGFVDIRKDLGQRAELVVAGERRDLLQEEALRKARMNRRLSLVALPKVEILLRMTAQE